MVDYSPILFASMPLSFSLTFSDVNTLLICERQMCKIQTRIFVQNLEKTLSKFVFLHAGFRSVSNVAIPNDLYIW